MNNKYSVIIQSSLEHIVMQFDAMCLLSVIYDPRAPNANTAFLPQCVSLLRGIENLW